MLSVLIAEDHAIIRRGIRSLLADECQCRNIGETPLAMLAESLHGRKWELVVLGLSLPDAGASAIAEIRRAHPAIRVFVLGLHSEHQYASKAVRAGAAAYLTKDASVNEFVAAYRKILAGGIYVSPSLTEKLIAGAGAGLPHETLSERESYVLRELAAGRRILEIAAALQLNAKTISTYRHSLLRKMGMKSDAQLVGYCIRHQLV